MTRAWFTLHAANCQLATGLHLTAKKLRFKNHDKVYVYAIYL